jgi:Tfp pilus assembly protein PilO
MKTDNRQKLLLIVIAVMIGLLVGDKLVYSPLVRAWKARQLEIAKLRTQLSNGSSLVRREAVIRERWQNMETNTLPNNPSLAQEQLLKALQAWAQESGVSLNAVTPQWKNDSDEYKTLVCRVDASGSLWMLSRFIYDIEKGPPGLRLDSVDFTSRDNTGKQLSLGLQVSGLVLTPQTK